MYSVILCGGSGTRLWPLSRKNYPKQFLNLYNDKSLLQETFLRMKKIMPIAHIFFITNEENYFNVYNQLKELDKNISPENIMIEPKSLNTAPAIAYSIKYLAEKIKIDVDAPIIFLPSDHFIKDEQKYLEVIKNALEKVDKNVGTIGITPTNAHTGYGYIKKGEFKYGYFKALEYIEKPDKKTAEEFVRSGQYVWNGGKYLFNIRTIADEFKKHAPQIYNLLTKNFETFTKEFHTLPNISIDYAISELSKKIVVFEGNFGWNDIGSFDALAEVLENQSNTDQINIDAKNIFAHSASKKLIAASGVSDLIIIENNDTILIQKKGESQNVKKVVEYLKNNNKKELEHNLIVHRPWGKYEVLIERPDHKVKKITVYPGAKLSLQSHLHRVEHWVVIKGVAKIFNKDKEITLKENESTFISAMSKHRLENPGKFNLEIVEVQTGKYLEEDDIIRYDDIYDRG